ncbi:MAG: aspartate aminotransferase family protein [Deltaproteobacteria bacterium]|nr:aspartate aminotransferase family protein [Deltaproteobacteria bacterium]MBW2724925.1 aspartate aminotransferase family protein [Deltaproteobacteria bacterium]
MSENNDSNTAWRAQSDKLLVPNYLPQPITLVRGEGCRLWDADGNEYLDMMGGIATAALGHCNPVVTRALVAQAEKLWHVSNLYTTAPQLELADRLIRHSFADRVFFANSGAEANEVALKLARRHHYVADRDAITGHDANAGRERTEIVAFEGSFHGRTLFTLTATGTPAYREGFEPVVPGVHHAPFNDLEATKKLVGDRTAAILVEPIQGEGGVRPASADFLTGLRQLADDCGCLLIFDEIQTGMGRTGSLFAYQKYGVVPDIMTLAKALGNGIPIGAMLTREEIAVALVPGTHGSTFGGNPLATACGAAVMAELTDGGVLAHAEQMGKQLGERLDAMAARLGPGRVVEARGVGLLRGVELTRPAAEIVAGCRDRGVLVITAGSHVLRLAPPLIISEAEIERGTRVLEDVLGEMPA